MGWTRWDTLTSFPSYRLRVCDNIDTQARKSPLMLAREGNHMEIARLLNSTEAVAMEKSHPVCWIVTHRSKFLPSFLMTNIGIRHVMYQPLVDRLWILSCPCRRFFPCSLSSHSCFRRVVYLDLACTVWFVSVLLLYVLFVSYLVPPMLLFFTVSAASILIPCSSSSLPIVGLTTRRSDGLFSTPYISSLLSSMYHSCVLMSVCSVNLDLVFSSRNYLLPVACRCLLCFAASLSSCCLLAPNYY